MSSGAADDVIALCATGSDVAAFAGGGATIFAVTAAAAAEADRRSLRYRELPYGTADEVAQTRRCVAAPIRSWINAADALVHEQWPGAGPHFRPAAGSHLVLWSLIGEVHVAMRALRRLIEAERPRVLALRKPHGEVIPLDLAVRPPALLFIAEDIARRTGVAVDVADGEHIPPREGLGTHSTLGISARRFLSLAKQWTMRPRHAATLVVGGGYDLAPLVDELRKRRAPVAFFRSHLRLGVDHEETARLVELARSDYRLLGCLQELEIADIQFIQRLLDTWWTSYVPALWDAFVDARAVLRRRRHDAVVAAEAGGGSAASAALQAAAEVGVRRFVYQHGSTFVLDATLWEGWLDNADELLVYGEGTVARIHETVRADFRPSTAITPVGSARLDRRPDETPKRGSPRRILYVPTLFGTYGRMLGDLADYPDAPYYRLQKEVLRLFVGRDDVQLIYKVGSATNAHENPIPALLREHVPTAHVIDAPSPAKLAREVDAIIVDHPVTALAEALVTSAPTVVFAPAGVQASTETDMALRLLRRRALVATDGEAFVLAVRELLDGTIDADSFDRSFVRRYVTHCDDGAAAARAVDAITSRATE